MTQLLAILPKYSLVFLDGCGKFLDERLYFCVWRDGDALLFPIHLYKRCVMLRPWSKK